MANLLDYVDSYYSERCKVPGYDNFEADRAGNIYKNSQLITPFKSSGYFQVCLTRSGHTRVVKGVHQVVSMTFDPNYYEGCVVHHIDGNKHNNQFSNLKVESRSEHARHHADPNRLVNHIKQHGPANKGKKMSSEFCEKCRKSAIERAKRDKENGVKRHNQYTKDEE